MTNLVYDAGALIAAERSNRRLAGLHSRALARGTRPIVPATVLAQVWRGPNHNLLDVLDGCVVLDFTRAFAQRTGELLALAGSDDTTDAHVVLCCIGFDAICVTSDRVDIEHLAEVARTARPRRTHSRMPVITI